MSLVLSVLKLPLGDGILHLVNIQNLILVSRFVFWKMDFQFGVVTECQFAYVSIVPFAQGWEVSREWAIWMRKFSLILFADFDFVFDPFGALFLVLHMDIACSRKDSALEGLVTWTANETCQGFPKTYVNFKQVIYVYNTTFNRTCTRTRTRHTSQYSIIMKYTLLRVQVMVLQSNFAVLEILAQVTVTHMIFLESF